MIPTLHGLSPQEPLKPKAGDISVLLAPSYAQASHLRQQISLLQHQFKGILNPTPYLQLQRFRIGLEALDALRPALRYLAQQHAPIDILAQSLEPFYSTLRAKEMLKCRVDIKAIYKLYEDLGTVLLEGNIPPLELDLSPHVTMLDDIRIIQLDTQPYQQLLFQAQRLVVVRLKGPGFYTALFSLPLAGCSSEEPRLEQGHL